MPNAIEFKRARPLCNDMIIEKILRELVFYECAEFNNNSNNDNTYFFCSLLYMLNNIYYAHFTEENAESQTGKITGSQRIKQKLFTWQQNNEDSMQVSSCCA